MIVNFMVNRTKRGTCKLAHFRIYKINQDTHKLVRTSTLKKNIT